jgi:hypothetical protein
MRLFYSLNGFQNTKRAKNNHLLFLVYSKYFFGLFLSKLGFSIGFLNLIELKRLADSLGTPVSPPRWV